MGMLAPRAAFAAPAEPALGAVLPPWRPGLLDIHHIATGRGDATLVIAPSGQVALIDAGAVARADPAQTPAMPDATRTPGAWIARYVRRRLAETGGSGLDAAMVTHLHPDHIGGVGPDTPLHPSGAYRPAGLSEVAELVPIRKLLDPDWPDYHPDRFEDAASAANYVAFARAFAASGGRVERLAVGRTDQLLDSATIGEARFAVRTVAARGRVWTGRGSEALDVFPPAASLSPGDRPNENAGSAALLIGYGPFRYFAGGDITDWADAGTRPWLNALTPAARAVGPVDVATLPHHGMFDAGSPATIRALGAGDWIIAAWHAAHPSVNTLEAAFSERLYPGARRVWATALHPAADIAMHRLTARLSSRSGHIVCRVAEGGRTYRVIVTGSGDEQDRITGIGPVQPAGSKG